MNRVSVDLTMAFSDFLLLTLREPFSYTADFFPLSVIVESTLAYCRLMQSDYCAQARFVLFKLWVCGGIKKMSLHSIYFCPAFWSWFDS